MRQGNIIEASIPAFVETHADGTKTVHRPQEPWLADLRDAALWVMRETGDALRSAELLDDAIAVGRENNIVGIELHATQAAIERVRCYTAQMLEALGKAPIGKGGQPCLG